MEWTEQRIELLTSLSQQGLSARDIATQLGGVSRDAVIGKLYRINKPGAGKPAPERVNTRPSRPVEDAPAGVVETPQPVVAEPAAPVEDVGSTVLIALQPHMCRWPYGDPTATTFRFCGATVDDGPYCNRHAAIAYQPKPERARPAFAGMRPSR